MPADTSQQPLHVPQVMVSSTVTDLGEHRAALIKAIHRHELHAIVMENDSAKLADVIDSSLQMVRDSAAYIAVISLKYGQTPECPHRNPGMLSATELEFNEARELGRPILLFIMGAAHRGSQDDFETDSEKKEKLNAFRESAKRKKPLSALHRVYADFNSLDEFKEMIGAPIAELRQHLATMTSPEAKASELQRSNEKHVPTRPALYAEPDYIGSHRFVGRDSQLQDLSDWASPADSTSLLLFEAIGGSGKSILTWEWITKHAAAVRPDCAGRFWYSFYERGAVMADFCRCALVYMTGRPLKELVKIRTPELATDLLAQLHDRPWLLVLDGLERVLVHYHRIDAAEVLDEDADAPTDKVLNRDPYDTIRDEDGDLLRRLAGARPSKILISSRLMPRVLLNPAGQAIPGAKRVVLPGLQPVEAEEFLRSCGIRGNSAFIRDYLASNCGNHPLVVGALAGLIANYLPDRGNFDAWVIDSSSQGGEKLNLADLDLKQRRNHILLAAIDSLPKKSRQLLSTLALMSEAVDYETLSALNPYLPPEPEEVELPKPPSEGPFWDEMNNKQRAEAKADYEAELARRKEYERASNAWRESEEVRKAPEMLAKTVRDLEQRGLLQYDEHKRRYDLHPVVRGVVAGYMTVEDRELYGQRVVDYFSAAPHSPYEQAKTLEDVATGVHIVRTLLKLGRFDQAASAYLGELDRALGINLEADLEILSLLRPFFPNGWCELSQAVRPSVACSLANCAAISLGKCGESEASVAALSSGMQSVLQRQHRTLANVFLWNVSRSLARQNTLAKAMRVDTLALEVAVALDYKEHLFKSRLWLFCDQSRLGQFEAAEETWRLLDPMGRNWSRSHYRQGMAEELFALNMFWQGTLQERHLKAAASHAEKDNNRATLRDIQRLGGSWQLERCEWTQAAASFREAVRMARERRLQDAESEAGLAVAKFHLGEPGQPEAARQEAERLAGQRDPHHRYVAMLWRAIDDHEQAEKHALAAYEWAWADGEPYVNRHELTKTTELLQEMDIPIPDLPPYDPAKDEPFSWESDVRAAIENLQAIRDADKEKAD